MKTNLEIVDSHCEEITHILVIEDSEFLAKYIQEVIIDYNKVVCDIAMNEEQAKDLIENNIYQLIIVDIYLPDSTGNFIGLLIRKKHKILIMTAKGNIQERSRLVKLPIVDYIAKTDKKSLARYLCSAIERLNYNKDSLVVVCDDSKISRRYIVNVLSNQNIPYIEFDDGDKALNYILKQKSKTNLLISDYEMPKMNGLELTRYIRLEYSPLELPILIQSGKSEAYDVANMLKAGANDYIKKPFAIEEFLIRINALLDHSRIFLQNQRLTEELNMMAMRDRLTGLYNRNYFYEYIQKVVSTVKRNHSKYAIIALDIDHFKAFNDIYGHDFGDLVLKNVSRTLKESIRTTDIVCRWGGEEFLVLAPEVDDILPLILAERIRVGISNLKIKKLDNEEYISITISGGIAIGNQENFEDVIKKADKRLYVAKESGRNKIIDKGE